VLEGLHSTLPCLRLLTMLSGTLELQKGVKGLYAPHRQRARTVRPHQPPQQQQQQHPKCSSSCSSRQVLVRSLPRIADFIRDECPIRALDGTFREQPARLGAELQDSCVVQVCVFWGGPHGRGGGLKDDSCARD